MWVDPLPWRDETGRRLRVEDPIVGGTESTFMARPRTMPFTKLFIWDWIFATSRRARGHAWARHAAHEVREVEVGGKGG